MPYASSAKKLARQKEYRKEMTESGYGKVLYARRAQRYKNEETLREAVTETLRIFESQDFALNDGMRAETIARLKQALKDSPVQVFKNVPAKGRKPKLESEQKARAVSRPSKPSLAQLEVDQDKRRWKS